MHPVLLAIAELKVKKMRILCSCKGLFGIIHTLNALVVTADNESWWNPDYLSTSLRAIGQWNDAIAAFASNYSDFSYLSNLRIQPTISNISEPGFDIYITWTGVSTEQYV